MSQEVITLFRYNGTEYEFDMRDAENAEKYEAAIQRMSETEKSAKKDGKSSTLIRVQCQMIKTFFDDCLEPGAGLAICTERDNFAICMEAYSIFLDMVRTQRDDILRAKNAFGQFSNRQQRRHPDQAK